MTGKTSIIILCHNQLEYTKQCIDSVLQHTHSPYELIIIDNASTDGTPIYLDRLRGNTVTSITTIRNEMNTGFPAGCNQGIAVATGDFIMLLNNDVVVTDGWLTGLMAHFRPDVGMVGPMTSYAAPPQQIPATYGNTNGELGAFAAQRKKDFAHSGIEVHRLTGFCLLIHKNVFARIGLLDERFGIGFYDDDDLCLRAIQVGFHLVMALDVFVHHYGSRTFMGSGIDIQKQLKDNLAIFKDKWKGVVE